MLSNTSLTCAVASGIGEGDAVAGGDAGAARLVSPSGQSREASVRRARLASHKRVTSSNALLTSGLTRGLGEGGAGAGGDAESAWHVGPSGGARQDPQSRHGSRSTSSKMRGCVTSYASERPVAFSVTRKRLQPENGL